jgi:tetratricopeptide (TPR) repeat protein
MNERRKVWLPVAALLSLLMLGFDEKTDRAAEVDLEEAQKQMEAGRWCEVRIALARAEGRLARGGPKALRERLEQMRKDVELLLRLEAVRLRAADGKGADARYDRAFREVGIDVTKLKAEDAADKLRASSVRQELLAALHYWAMVKPAGPARKALWELADAVDDNAWRKRFRGAIEKKDAKTLIALASEAETQGQPAEMLCLLAAALRQASAPAEAIKVLRDAQWRYPSHFWINHDLAELLSRQPTGREEAVGFYRAALALRPHSPGSYLGLGTALMEQGKLDDALRSFRQAIALDPANATAHLGLGVLLLRKGRMAEAEACFRRAIALDPRSANAHMNLGNAMAAMGKRKEAIACFQKAIDLDPRNAMCHLCLGNTLLQGGMLAEAMACFRRAIELDPRSSAAHMSLGGALAATGKNEEAITAFRKALALDPKNASAHLNLGNILHRLGKVDEAIACYRAAIALAPQFAPAHLNLGHALRGKGRLAEAIACFRKAVELQPDFAPAKKALEAAMKENAGR